MATYTGTFTIKGNDLGNLPYYYDLYVKDIAGKYEQVNGGNGGQWIADLNLWLTDYCNTLMIAYGGTASYTYTGPGGWNAGTDTDYTITWTGLTNVGSDVIPYFFILSTEDYTYTVKISEVGAVTTVCNECQFIQLTQCGDESFALDLGLPDGPYTAYYTDNTSGVVWEQGTYSSTAQGGLAMYQWDATIGMFNNYSLYTLTIRDTNGDAVSWIVNGIEYNCATITFKTTVNVTD